MYGRVIEFEALFLEVCVVMIWIAGLVFIELECVVSALEEHFLNPIWFLTPFWCSILYNQEVCIFFSTRTDLVAKKCFLDSKDSLKGCILNSLVPPISCSKLRFSSLCNVKSYILEKIDKPRRIVFFRHNQGIQLRFLVIRLPVLLTPRTLKILRGIGKQRQKKLRNW